MDLRAAADADLEPMREVFLAATGELFSRHRLPPPQPSPVAFAATQRHIAATGTSVVAGRDGRLDGFAAALVRGDDWFLSSLFVRPEAQARGLGSALLDAVWGDGHLRRRTITDAFQPISNALYGRRGLVPATPLLSFAGAPELPDPAAAEAPADLAAIDAAAYGFDRAVDHVYWSGYALF